MVRPEDGGKFYSDKVPNIRHSAALIHGDIPAENRMRFDELIGRACGHTYPNENTHEARQSVLADIDEIIKLTRDA
jgi:hypothetical protein